MANVLLNVVEQKSIILRINNPSQRRKIDAFQKSFLMNYRTANCIRWVIFMWPRFWPTLSTSPWGFTEMASTEHYTISSDFRILFKACPSWFGKELPIAKCVLCTVNKVLLALRQNDLRFEGSPKAQGWPHGQHVDAMKRKDNVNVAIPAYLVIRIDVVSYDILVYHMSAVGLLQ